MKLLKIVSVLPLGVFSVRLSSTTGEEQCWCVNDPVAGISSPKLPQDDSGSAAATAKRTVRSGELKEEQISQPAFQALYQLGQ